MRTAPQQVLHYENMYRELTNLLPTERSRAFRHEYFLRLVTVTLLVVSFVVVACGVMLVPSYLAFTDALKSKQEDLARVSSVLESSEEKEVGARLAQLEADGAHLARLASMSSVSGMARSVLAVPRPGITLEQFAYSPGKEAGEQSIMLSGKAQTRDALRQYNLALTALPFVKRSDLPISAYAQETDLMFTITLTGASTP